MPDAFLRPCNKGGCLRLSREKYCEQHKRDNDERDATDKLYAQTAWKGRYGFRRAILLQNPFCQKLTEGKRCHNLAKVLHHLISPRTRPDLFLSPSNVAAVCVEHHPVNTDTPDWVAGIDFVPTQYEVTI
jgi:5-methylcytosine-specific restriction enzyme A